MKSLLELSKLEYKPIKYNAAFWREQSKDYLIAEIESMAKEIFQHQKTLTLQQEYFNQIRDNLQNELNVKKGIIVELKKQDQTEKICALERQVQQQKTQMQNIKMEAQQEKFETELVRVRSRPGTPIQSKITDQFQQYETTIENYQKEA